MQKIEKVELCVSSKLYDLVAISAKTTLKEMGYTGLSSLSREIYFSFDIEGCNRDEARAMVENIVKKTSIFVNPNKDTYRIGGVKKEGFVNVLIWYIDDKRGEIIKEQLKNQGWNRILDVFPGEVWHIGLSEESQAIEVVKSLLVNPHSQGYEIL